MGKKRQQIRRTVIWVMGVLIALYLVLLIPESAYVPPPAMDTQPFEWNQEEIWRSLESRFLDARAAGCEAVLNRIDTGLMIVRRYLEKMDSIPFGSGAGIFDTLENQFFSLAADVAACPGRLADFISLYSRLRMTIKDQSTRWDMGDIAARETLYRLLYGGRQAVEEIILQSENSEMPLITGVPEPSQTPSAPFLGIRVHSGDVLVSRGGAPTSALIARGNDYAGNFSHVALLHVDEQSKKISIVESHIECGVLISDTADYLRDTKLRIMILRPRSDIRPILDDPLLPHRAASQAVSDAAAGHIPYDFEMDFKNPDRLFCSEVASAAYRAAGMTLWMGMSYISSPGLRSWLGSLGIRYFETQEPSDLEYDPQLRVIADWRDSALLRKDHFDNAAIDVMLETSDSPESFGYDWYLLPVARTMKAYSSILNLFGKIGPVPEGMNATAALRVQRFSDRHHELTILLERRADAFRDANGYFPPYWVLIDLAREVKAQLRIP